MKITEGVSRLSYFIIEDDEGNTLKISNKDIFGFVTERESSYSPFTKSMLRVNISMYAFGGSVSIILYGDNAEKFLESYGKL